jgi:hypothetical protein
MHPCWVQAHARAGFLDRIDALAREMEEEATKPDLLSLLIDEIRATLDQQALFRTAADTQATWQQASTAGAGSALARALS